MRLPVLIFVCFLSACSSQINWTEKDYLKLKALQRAIPHNTDYGQNAILVDLIHYNPVDLANQAAQKNDYALISFTAGYEAIEKDATIIGLECNKEVETRPLVFGCMPPTEPVLYKQIIRYNWALYNTDGFPYKEICQIPKEFETK